jgi:hypothetical protein
MNPGRFAAAAVATWLVRTVLNAVFYTQIVAAQYQHVYETHPGVFREVIPAYIAADFAFAVVFVLLFVKAGEALGSGPRGGAMLGFYVGLLGPALLSVYMFYSTMYLSVGLAVSEGAFGVVNCIAAGAAAGAVYKR